jgi:Ca2+-binding EF-hand superfamily protein
MSDEGTFGERADLLVKACAALDSKKTGKLPTSLVAQLLKAHESRLTDDELKEFLVEADGESGAIKYEKFVREIIFGKI